MSTQHAMKVVVLCGPESSGKSTLARDLASTLTQAGVQVALVEATDQVLAPLDPEMATPARRAALGRGRPAPGVRGHRHR